MRHLSWDGCENARDFGGLRTNHNTTTAWKQFIRSDSTDQLSAAGWEKLEEHGVKTVIDLRDPSERFRSKAPSSVTKIDLPLEDNTDIDFWRQWRRYSSTPLYYKAFMERNTERIAHIFSTMADVDSGAIVIHCVAGRDRTGLISLLLQGLADVQDEEMIADYELSTTRLQAPIYKHERPYIDRLYNDEKTNSREALHKVLAELKAAEYLQRCGVEEKKLNRIRERLLSTRHSEI